jgi:hypothetical protein
MGKKTLKALADRGYFSAPEIKACADAGIAPLVPNMRTSSAKADCSNCHRVVIPTGSNNQDVAHCSGQVAMEI